MFRFGIVDLFLKDGDNVVLERTDDVGVDELD
jgi:hypothetical protein